MRLPTGFAAVFLFATIATGAGHQSGEAPHPPEVNDPAPDFELEDSQGESYRLSELRGKNVILEFIRSGSW